MQKAVVTTIGFDYGRHVTEVPVAVVIDPPDTENRQISFSAVNLTDPPFSAITLDLVELLEVLEDLQEILAVPTDLHSHQIAELKKRYISHEDTLSRLAIRVGDLESQVKDLENRLDGLFDDVHHGGDD
ncbi:MAG: hypothetical protein ACHWZW_23030 [Spirulina sp.]